MKTPKEVFSARLDSRLIEQARISGVDLPSLFEAAIANLFKEKKCPYCGEYKKHKWEKKR